MQPSSPRVGNPEFLLEAKDLKVTFRAPGGKKLHAVDTITLGVRPRETVGLVGESGSGKSTVALTLMRAHEPEGGQIIFDGQDVTHLTYKELMPVRRRLQMVFQDPYSSLDPRWSIRRVIGEPLRAHKYGSRAKINERVAQLLQQVGLPPDAADRVPSQFSGGQRQRIAVARALALEPKALIADEPVSSLDVSIQAQIINLLRDLQERLGIALLVIAHDLALVHQISDRIIVMYLGEPVEEGPADEVVGKPQHPYTVALLSATPVPEPGGGSKRIVLTGEPPSPIYRPTGCRFHPRCPIARDRCKTEKPPLKEIGPNRRVSCFYAGEMPPPRDLWALENVPLPPGVERAPRPFAVGSSRAN
ncbi:MAG: ABC transporter ATP-binding protein [Alphaproteobacteria bacterium]|nr:ABC transporter ATP-binding protein [Alphaproteobacteria bacterium]